MKTSHFISLLVIIFNTLTFSQTSNNSGYIAGKVIEITTKNPIPFIAVKIIESGKLITSTQTNDSGEFTLKNVPLKQVSLEISVLGYSKFSKEVTLSENNTILNLETISLATESKEIEMVTVVKERSTIEQKADRKVVTIGKDLIASGTTASEIFNNIPTVNIDPQTKELSLRGNSNVRVLIDGKPSNIDAAQLLQQIPSASIKQVELITNPSSKYNPEGNSGIINIILNKNSSQGFNGSVTSGFTFGITPKTNQSLNLNYKVGKVNFYSNYGFNHGKNANEGWIEAERPSLFNRQDFAFKSTNTSHLAKVGADFYINDNNILSFFTNWNINDGKGTSRTDVNYYNIANTDEIQLNNNNSGSVTQTYDLNYKHNFKKKGEVVEFQGNHSITNNEDVLQYINNGNIRDVSLDNTTNYTQFNIDYTNPLSETAKIEIGYESRIQDGKNKFLEALPLTIFTNSPFSFNRNIHSVYTNYSKTIGKFSAQLGVRIEQYNLDASFNKSGIETNIIGEIPTNTPFDITTNVEDAIFTAYPSAYLSFKPNEKNTFNINYTRRVDRPSIGQLNPIREWTTPLVESRGNPELEPQFTNSFELNHTKILSIGSVTSAIFYRLINNVN